MMVLPVEINGHCFSWHPSPLELPETLVRNATDVLAQWVTAFPFETTLIQRLWHVPAGVVRFDCVGHPDRLGEANGRTGLFIHEVEDRPSKLGLMSVMDEGFRTRLTDITNEWVMTDQFRNRLCVVYLNEEERDLADDMAWVEECSVEQGIRENRPLLIRGFPPEDQYDAIASRSMFAVRHHADKSYGERLGWWRRVTAYDLAHDASVWNNSFALKPCNGEAGRSVVIWAPEAHRDGVSGADTRSEIWEVMNRHDSMYLQPFIEPMSCPYLDGWLMIYRIYFGYSPCSEQFVPLGGLWNARHRHLKIIGAKDEIYGPLQLSG